MASRAEQPAVYDCGNFYSYGRLLDGVRRWGARLAVDGVSAGAVVAVLGDFNFDTCCLMLALIFKKAILMPLTYAVGAELASLLAIGSAECIYEFPQDAVTPASFRRLDNGAPNPMVASYRKEMEPGLIVFTSGSTGKPKGILHNCERVVRKFIEPRQARRTLLFLMMDHFGGFNTFLSAFSYGGVAVCLPERSVQSVCRTIEDSKTELLPTTPTFLNLLITSGAYRAHDLSSVALITYGTEVMPAMTLEKLKIIFPHAQTKQTYGLSELGVLRSKSEHDESLWVKIGGSGFETSIRDGILWIRSEANMVGYLNAPNPFDVEGWFCTGDHVEIRGEYVRILGRKSDLINVGGQKVFPSEVEDVLLQADNIGEASVFASKHPLMGSVVGARISLKEPEDPDQVKNRLRKWCVGKLAKYKTPVKFEIVGVDELRSERFKKIRTNDI